MEAIMFYFLVWIGSTVAAILLIENYSDEAIFANDYLAIAITMLVWPLVIGYLLVRRLVKGRW